MGGMDHQTGVTVHPSYTGPGWETIKYLSIYHASWMTWSLWELLCPPLCTHLATITCPSSIRWHLPLLLMLLSSAIRKSVFKKFLQLIMFMFTYCDVGSHTLLEPDALPWSRKLTSYNWGLCITECTGIIRKESFFGSLFLNRAQSLINIDVIHYYWTLLTSE